MATIVDYLGGLVLPDTPATPLPAALAPAARLPGFRRDYYQCLRARTDALFELTDALPCADGLVTSLVELSLTAEHCRRSGNSPAVGVARSRNSVLAMILWSDGLSGQENPLE